jgi:hypothetical protein
MFYSFALIQFSFYDSSEWLLTLNSALYSRGADPTENTVSQQFVGVFTAPLSINKRHLLSRIVVRVTQQRALYQESVFAGTCLSSRCVSTDLCPTIIYLVIFEILRVVLYNYCLLGYGTVCFICSF